MIPKVADTRRKTEAEQVTKGEDVVRIAGRVGVVLFDLQLCVGDWNANNNLVPVAADGNSASCARAI